MPRDYYPDHFLARLPAGTIDRLRGLLRDGEKPAELVREAISEALRIREACAQENRGV